MAARPHFFNSKCPLPGTNQAANPVNQAELDGDST